MKRFALVSVCWLAVGCSSMRSIDWSTGFRNENTLSLAGYRTLEVGEIKFDQTVPFSPIGLGDEIRRYLSLKLDYGPYWGGGERAIVDVRLVNYHSCQVPTVDYVLTVRDAETDRPLGRAVGRHLADPFATPSYRPRTPLGSLVQRALPGTSTPSGAGLGLLIAHAMGQKLAEGLGRQALPCPEPPPIKVVSKN